MGLSGNRRRMSDRCNSPLRIVGHRSPSDVLRRLAIARRDLNRHLYFERGRCQTFVNATKFLVCPTGWLKCSLLQLVTFLTHFFSAPKPTLQDHLLAAWVSRSAAWGRTFQKLLEAESACAFSHQNTLQFKGIIEADGTGLRRYHHKDRVVHLGARGLVQRLAPGDTSPLKTASWLTSLVTCKAKAVTRVESLGQVEETGGDGVHQASEYLHHPWCRV